ncbi:GerMN domain-containing protein [Paenibacillus sp. SN-8-1]|uniref:GerMN domain-containing protein n=1 Tax=Paenibacillus sp. SN-8-1 TaxID=3435409 RepID=UPI003D9A5E33
MRKGMATGLLILLMLVSAGCAQKPQSAPPSNEQVSSSGVTSGNQENQEKNTPSDSQAGSKEVTAAPSGPSNQAEKSGKKLSISSYYTDNDMMDLKEEHKEITYTSEHDKYEEAFKTLKDSGDQKLFALWQKVELKSIDLKDGELTINIHLPDEARLGAGGETLAIDALKRTFFQFDEVKSIELLVDGGKVDTLMGHDELEHPMTRS